MLEHILKLYTMAMIGDVRSPMPHLVGPPGAGKSTVIEQAAMLLGVNLHIINVSRISPLELEGVQMPVHHVLKEGESSDQPIQRMKLELLTATFWTQLRENDILLLDEFLRGFPEVYNGLLDILTSREVGGFKLPKVFIIGASNSTVAYDKALEDRLLHIPVPDPRKRKSVRNELAQLIVDELGLLPSMTTDYSMTEMFNDEILPMYEILDSFKPGGAGAVSHKGTSIRNLIGQAKLREIKSGALRSLIQANNARCTRESKPQYILLPSGAEVPAGYVEQMAKVPKSKLTEIQRLNLELNTQLIALETMRKKKGTEDDDIIDEPPF